MTEYIEQAIDTGEALDVLELISTEGTVIAMARLEWGPRQCGFREVLNCPIKTEAFRKGRYMLTRISSSAERFEHIVIQSPFFLRLSNEYFEPGQVFEILSLNTTSLEK